MSRRMIAAAALLGIVVTATAAMRAPGSAPDSQVQITVTSPEADTMTFTIAIWSDAQGQSRAVRGARTPFTQVVTGTDIRAMVLAAPTRAFNAEIVAVRDGRPVASPHAKGSFQGAAMLHRSTNGIGVQGF